MINWVVRAVAILSITLATGCFQGPTIDGPDANEPEPPAPPSPILDAQGAEDTDETSPELDVPVAPDDAVAGDVPRDAEEDAELPPPPDASVTDVEPEPETTQDTTTPEETTPEDIGEPLDTLSPLEVLDDAIEGPQDASDAGPIEDDVSEPTDTSEPGEDVTTEPGWALEGPCCDPGDSATCEDLICTTLVCAVDPYCCQYKWDQLCAEKAVTYCAVCDLSDAGSCCEANETPKCEDYGCVQAVCAKDAFCCDTAWDTFCAKCSAGLPGFQDLPCPGVESECGCEPPDPEVPSAFEMAQHWAPVWYQDTDADNYKADYMVAYDFDGDTRSSNNWENLDSDDINLGAIVYFAVVETETHWYLTYANFHPRDWAKSCSSLFAEPCHENDMEGVMVMVKKDGTPHGEFVLLVTEAHNTLHVFANDPAITEGTNPHFEQGVEVTFEDGSHPEVYVESKGHGVCALYFDGPNHCKHDVSQTPPAFGDGDGVVYRYKGKSEIPTSGNDDDVGYSLRSIEYSIWLRRFDICDGDCTFDTEMNYDGTTLAKAFDGDTYGDDKANPPWAWDDPDDGPVYRGDFFFRPAKTVKTHVNIPGEVSQNYLLNPFLDSLD